MLAYRQGKCLENVEIKKKSNLAYEGTFEKARIRNQLGMI